MKKKFKKKSTFFITLVMAITFFSKNVLADKLRNPFEKIKNEFTLSEQNKKHNINNYSIHVLKLSGILSISKKKFAILQDPSGIFYKTAEGSFIGSEKANVMYITENEVILSFFEKKEKARIVISNEDF